MVRARAGPAHAPALAQALVIAYPVLTLFDIMVTGNHYWIDGLGGLACLGVGYLIARGTAWWEARRGAIADPTPHPPDASERRATRGLAPPRPQ